MACAGCSGTGCRCVPGQVVAASSASAYRWCGNRWRQPAAVRKPRPNGAQVLCIDNEDSILIGMHSLLSRWGCQVWTARNREECEGLLKQGIRPQLALVDYHLDDGETGTELMAWLRTRLNQPLPGVVISADGRPETVARVHGVGLDYLAKPVKPAALRALLSRHLTL